MNYAFKVFLIFLGLHGIRHMNSGKFCDTSQYYRNKDARISKLMETLDLAGE